MASEFFGILQLRVLPKIFQILARAASVRLIKILGIYLGEVLTRSHLLKHLLCHSVQVHSCVGKRECNIYMKSKSQQN